MVDIVLVLGIWFLVKKYILTVRLDSCHLKRMGRVMRKIEMWWENCESPCAFLSLLNSLSNWHVQLQNSCSLINIYYRYLRSIYCLAIWSNHPQLTIIYYQCRFMSTLDLSNPERDQILWTVNIFMLSDDLGLL